MVWCAHLLCCACGMFPSPHHSYFYVQDGGALAAESFGAVRSTMTLRMWRCVVSDCQAAGNGGALHLYDEHSTGGWHAVIFSTVFRGNNAGVVRQGMYSPAVSPSGGAVWAQGVNIELQNCTLSQNSANFKGGAILIQSAHVSLDGCKHPPYHPLTLKLVIPTFVCRCRYGEQRAGISEVGPGRCNFCH